MLVERNRVRCIGSVLMAAGFDPFLERAASALRRTGIDAGNLITESFGPQP